MYIISYSQRNSVRINTTVIHTHIQGTDVTLWWLRYRKMKSRLISHWVMLEDIVAYMPWLSLKLLYHRFVCPSVCVCPCLYALEQAYIHTCVYVCACACIRPHHYSNTAWFMINNGSQLFSIFQANLGTCKVTNHYYLPFFVN